MLKLPDQSRGLEPALTWALALLLTSTVACGPQRNAETPSTTNSVEAREQDPESQKRAGEEDNAAGTQTAGPPDNQELSSRLRLALALNREAEWRAALDHLEVLREYQPTSWIVQLEFAYTTYRLNGDREVVRSALEESLSLNETNPRALVMLGQLHEDQGESQEAEEYYRRGIELRASDPEPHLALARVLRRTGRHQEAVEILEKLVRKERGSVRMRVLLANAYEAAGDLESAGATWKQVAFNHADPLQGKTLLYRYLVRTNQMKEANALAKEITILREERAQERGLRPLQPSPQ